MAKGSGKKASKKPKGAPTGRDRRAERLERALAAGLKRESKAASCLEAAQLEVAVLRMALAEVVGEGPGERELTVVAEVETGPTPKAPAARPRVARTVGATRASAAPKGTPKPAKAPATKAPVAPAARPRRTTRPAPADR